MRKRYRIEELEEKVVWLTKMLTDQALSRNEGLGYFFGMPLPPEPTIRGQVDAIISHLGLTFKVEPSRKLPTVVKAIGNQANTKPKSKLAQPKPTKE